MLWAKGLFEEFDVVYCAVGEEEGFTSGDACA